MSYTYDILVNFNSDYYDFFDWNDNDNIIHIKKLPILKVESTFLFNAKYADIIVEKLFVDKIYNKTDFFKNKKFDNYNYVCALTDGREAFVVRLDSSGRIIGRSSLMIDEENEIIDISDSLEVNNFSSIVNSTYLPVDFKTRKEIQINGFILNELKVISDEKLRYLYFDCFNCIENDINIILNNIKYEITNNFEHVYHKIYDFLKLSSIKNNQFF